MARARKLAALALGAMVTAGCAGTHRPARRPPPWASRSAHHPRPASLAHAPVDESAALVVGRIQAAGYRFGTDGSAGALWGYMRTSQQLISAEEARPGDVVFFDTRTRMGDGPPACADRLGIVEDVDAQGRITFLEVHGGRYQRGYVNPRLPASRRDDRGEVINTFLRPKHITDADGTRYFAGEMLCGVARIRTR